jgi:hypothetical protein
MRIVCCIDFLRPDRRLALLPMHTSVQPAAINFPPLEQVLQKELTMQLILLFFPIHRCNDQLWQLCLCGMIRPQLLHTGAAGSENPIFTL